MLLTFQNLHIFLCSHLFLDISSAIYMYGPFAIGVKKSDGNSNSDENQNSFIRDENFFRVIANICL